MLLCCSYVGGGKGAASPTLRAEEAESVKKGSLFGDVFALEAALVFLDEHGTEVGMRDADEVFGAMLESAALEAGDAVLGDEVVDVVAGGGDGGTRGKEGLDAGDGALGGGGGHGDDALAFAGHGGAADEVDLAADAVATGTGDGRKRVDLTHEAEVTQEGKN